MWTYRNGPKSMVETNTSNAFSARDTNPQSFNAPFNSKKVEINTKHQTTPHAKMPHKHKCNVFIRNSCFLYLIGIVIGAICSKICTANLLQYAKYYTENAFNLFLDQNYALIFSNHYLTFLIQFTVVLIFGFCAFGIVLIPLFVLLKGIGTGCFFSFLYMQLGAFKGMLSQILFFIFPELIGFLLILLLCNSSWKVSKKLFSSCIRRASSNLFVNCKSLLHRYLLLCMLSAIPCALEALASMLFSPLFI